MASSRMEDEAPAVNIHETLANIQVRLYALSALLLIKLYFALKQKKRIKQRSKANIKKLNKETAITQYNHWSSREN